MTEVLDTTMETETDAGVFTRSDCIHVDQLASAREELFAVLRKQYGDSWVNVFDDPFNCE